MTLSNEQYKRQLDYEGTLYYLEKLVSIGLLTQEEYHHEKALLESKYKPIIEHNPLLYKQ